MDIRDLLSRLRGFSTPFGGLSWNPPSNERDAANRLVVFLYDRRVLHAPHEVEMPEHVVASVLGIRQELADISKQLRAGGRLELKLRAMRAACAHFLDRVQRREDTIRFGRSHGHYASWEFMDALGQWRAFMAVYLGMVCAGYRLEPPPFLSGLLPSTVEPTGGRRPNRDPLLDKFEALPIHDRRRQLAELEEYLSTPEGAQEFGLASQPPRGNEALKSGRRLS